MQGQQNNSESREKDETLDLYSKRPFARMLHIVNIIQNIISIRRNKAMKEGDTTK